MGPARGMPSRVIPEGSPRAPPPLPLRATVAPLRDPFAASDEPTPVWADPEGTGRGQELEPLYHSLPLGAEGRSSGQGPLRTLGAPRCDPQRTRRPTTRTSSASRTVGTHRRGRRRRGTRSAKAGLAPARGAQRPEGRRSASRARRAQIPGRQKHDDESFTSAPAQALEKRAPTALASSFFFFFCILSARSSPKSDQPFSAFRARSSR